MDEDRRCTDKDGCELSRALQQEVIAVRSEMKAMDESHESSTSKTRKLVWLSIFIGVLAEVVTAIVSKG